MRGFDFGSLALAVVFSFLAIPLNAGQQQGATGAPKAGVSGADVAAKPTPRLADGRPDLNGVWYPWAGRVSPDTTPKGRTLEDGSIIASYAYERRYDTQRAEADTPRPARAVPPYKPELLAKVKDLSDRQSEADPYPYACKPPGLPRIGPPHQIVQGARELVFIYSDVNGNFWRIVPTDGRGHIEDADASYLGDSIARWEGDTLVVNVINFNDDTWFSGSGHFHSTALRVTERLTRRGDSLLYEVTVEDPEVLTGPWKLPPRTLDLTQERLEEAPHCKDMDRPHLTNLDHH